jgi:hypothetical protein
VDLIPSHLKQVHSFIHAASRFNVITSLYEKTKFMYLFRDGQNGRRI